MTTLISVLAKVAAFIIVTILGVPALHAAPRIGVSPPVFAPHGSHIMCLGDSITAGFQSSDGNGYRLYLLNKLPTGYGMVGGQRDGTVPDEGHSGYTIAQLQQGFPGWYAANPSGVILLDAGTNDARGGATADQMTAAMSSLLNAIRRAAPSARVIVAKLTISAGLPASAQAAEAGFNQALSAAVAPLGGWVRLADMSSIPATQLADGIHPDDAGYAAMASDWWRILGPWIGAA